MLDAQASRLAHSQRASESIVFKESSSQPLLHMARDRAGVDVVECLVVACCVRDRLARHRQESGNSQTETDFRMNSWALLQGDKVKLTVQFKGREMQHVDVGRGLFSVRLFPQHRAAP